jgi:probable rRNA maturation factor
MTTAVLTADILVNADCWAAEPEAEAVVRRAILAAAAAVQADDGEVAVVLTDDSGIRALNSQWRGKDTATNVLSFPAPPSPKQDGLPDMLGDIAIAFETTQREAQDENKPFQNHLGHLAVHGFLHLVGYDHESDDDADAMEQLERQILARLGIPDPYQDHPDQDHPDQEQ